MYINTEILSIESFFIASGMTQFTKPFLGCYQHFAASHGPDTKTQKFVIFNFIEILLVNK